MTPSNAHEYLHIMQAMVEGKTIQINANPYGPACHADWQDLSLEHVVDFTSPASSYRIKPLEITTTRLVWLNEKEEESKNLYTFNSDGDESFWRIRGWKLRKVTITYTDEEPVLTAE